MIGNAWKSEYENSRACRKYASCNDIMASCIFVNIESAFLSHAALKFVGIFCACDPAEASGDTVKAHAVIYVPIWHQDGLLYALVRIYLFRNDMHIHIWTSSQSRKEWFYCLVFSCMLLVVSPGMHIHVSVNCVIIGSSNGSSPVRCQAITWTDGDLLTSGSMGTNLSEILFKSKYKNQWNTCENMVWKMGVILFRP